MQQNLDEQYWSKRWDDGTTNWDIGAPAPAIITYFNNFTPKDIPILIPGCGNAYEAEELWKLGFTNITIVDIVQQKALALKEKFKHTGIQVIHADFFSLSGLYKIIIEHTFFCSLPPSKRIDYAKKMTELLLPEGKVIGLLFNRTFEHEGPPFGGNIDTYMDIFEPYFSEITMSEAYNSIPQRAGKELFIKLQQ